MEEEKGPVGGGPGAVGRNGAARGRRSPEEARETRRARLLEAAIAVLGESGVTGATVAAVSEYAGISRSGFYETFGSTTECLLTAHRQALERLGGVVSTAFIAQATWDRGVVAALAALVGLLDVEPQLSRVLLVEAPALGEAVQEQRQQTLQSLQTLLDTRAGEKATNGTHTLRAEAAIGAVAEILRARANTGQPSPCTPLLAELVEVVLVQYETPHEQREAARGQAVRIVEESAVRPPTPVAAPPRRPRAFPINERAFRMNDVILHLEVDPGASNQEIARESVCPTWAKSRNSSHACTSWGCCANTPAGRATPTPGG